MAEKSLANQMFTGGEILSAERNAQPNPQLEDQLLDAGDRLIEIAPAVANSNDERARRASAAVLRGLNEVSLDIHGVESSDPAVSVLVLTKSTGASIDALAGVSNN